MFHKRISFFNINFCLFNNSYIVFNESNVSFGSDLAFCIKFSWNSTETYGKGKAIPVTGHEGP
jgi:hypothetical protein